MTTSTSPTIGDLLAALRELTPERRAEVWPELVEAFKLMRLSPRAIWPAGGDPEPYPHGHFRSHLDLPLLTPEQSQRMAPVFNATYELVRQHQHCSCDPTVMAWRAAYAAALALLAPPPPDGPFRPDGQDAWGWRCSLAHGDYMAAIERFGSHWGRREAVKAYRSHMKTKHPEEIQP